MSDQIIYQDEYVMLTRGKIHIGGVFLDCKQIRFIEVVRQDYPIGRNMFLVGGWFTLFIYLISLVWGGWLFFLILALIEFGIGYGCFQRKYALRIGYDMGTTKALISSDRVYLQKVKQITERILMRNEVG